MFCECMCSVSLCHYSSVSRHVAKSLSARVTENCANACEVLTTLEHPLGALQGDLVLNHFVFLSLFVLSLSS